MSLQISKVNFHWEEPNNQRPTTSSTVHPTTQVALAAAGVMGDLAGESQVVASSGAKKHLLRGKFLEELVLKIARKEDFVTCSFQKNPFLWLQHKAVPRPQENVEKKETWKTEHWSAVPKVLQSKASAVYL